MKGITDNAQLLSQGEAAAKVGLVRKLGRKLLSAGCFFAVMACAVAFTPAQSLLVNEAVAQPSNYQNYLTFEMSENTIHDAEKIAEHKENVYTFLSEHFTGASADVIRESIQQAYETGKKYDIDPLLILSIIAIESAFNPKAKSKAGAVGLMQVLVKLHKSKFNSFGGVKAATEVVPAIEVGTRILKEYVNKTGSLAKGLKLYVGSAFHEHDYGYGGKVITMRTNLQVAVMGDITQAKILAKSPGYQKLKSQTMLASAGNRTNTSDVPSTQVIR